MAYGLMWQILTLLLVMVLLGALVLLLWAIIRFSVVSPYKTRGAAERLRRPDLIAVQNLCGFALPPVLDAFYRQSPLVEQGEFTFVDHTPTPPARWPIGRFIPLAAEDVREWRLISGVPGVPIADDGDKGMYYVARDGSIRLSSPNVSGGDILVTVSATDFLQLPVEQEDAE